jgi:hypothetical protein
MNSQAIKETEMDRKFGYFVFGGMLIGALFGSGVGAANGNAIAGIGLGALVGAFLGWFIGAAVSQGKIGKKEDK